MQLYRKGLPMDFGSSWFPTIEEAINWDGDVNGEDISIIWLSKDEFRNLFEASGVGYRAKNTREYLRANPRIETLSLDLLDEKLSDPELSNQYWDGRYFI